METEARGDSNSLGPKLASWPQKVRNYVDDLRAEMRRVTWPSWTQVRATTVVVIVSVFAFAAYFAIVDLAITRLVTKIFDVFTK